MVIPVILFIIGLVLLIKGGDWFVDGASGIAHRFHIPELLIGATVVSIGTTLPEVMVSAQGALKGSGAMAYGNAIGSIICNTSLIAALTIAIKPGKVNTKTLVVPTIFFFAASAIYVVSAYVFGYFYWWVGVILLLVFLAYMFLTVRSGLKERDVESVELESSADEGEEKSPLWLEIALLVVGAAVIAVGADLLVDNGTIIARELQIPLQEVYGVATFYAQFALSPKGKYAISVCLGTACYVKGAQEILDEICAQLGIEAEECTEDGKYSVTACRCIGACGLAPVLTVNDDVYGRLVAADVKDILAKYQ